MGLENAKRPHETSIENRTNLELGGCSKHPLETNTNTLDDCQQYGATNRTVSGSFIASSNR